MKYIIKTQFYMLALYLFIGTGLLFSQNTAVNWSAESGLITVNAVDAELSSLLTKQGNTIVWEQESHETTLSDTFSILSITGNWDNQNALGTITYGLSIDGVDGSLQLNGTTDGITMTLSLSNGNATANTYTLHIDTLTPDYIKRCSLNLHSDSSISKKERT
jgi:hypothetical protein